MKPDSFLKLVEIRTKLASMIPFSLGTLYALYRFHQFKPLNFLILFISILSFDMVTTALNNYFDFRRATVHTGYNYEQHNAIVRDRLKETRVIATIAALLAIAVASGLFLFFRTDAVVLLLGIISFGIGISYSFGPFPISRTPFGEIFSGLFMGFVITFLSVYVHVYDRGLAQIVMDNWKITAGIDLRETIFIFLVSVPSVIGIANIMLANNICDIDEDLVNKRFTLPNYIGRLNSLRLFKGLYIAAYIDLVISVLLGVLPAAALLALITILPVFKNVKVFYGIQTKKDTFSLSVKNFTMICVSEAILTGISILVGLLF